MNRREEAGSLMRAMYVLCAGRCAVMMMLSIDMNFPFCGFVRHLQKTHIPTTVPASVSFNVQRLHVLVTLTQLNDTQHSKKWFLCGLRRNFRQLKPKPLFKPEATTSPMGKASTTPHNAQHAWFHLITHPVLPDRYHFVGWMIHLLNCVSFP